MGVSHQLVPSWQRNFARALRRDQTDAEGLLWWAIRRHELGFRFRRQHPIGPYIVDFVSLSERLVIEVDGEDHNEGADGERDRELERRGFRVLRFWNADVFSGLDGVLDEIVRVIEGDSGNPPSPSSLRSSGTSPTRGEEPLVVGAGYLGGRVCASL